MCVLGHEVGFDSLPPLGLSLDFPGGNTGVGCSFLLQAYLPDPGVEPLSPPSPALAGGFFTTEPPGKRGYPQHHLLSKPPLLAPVLLLPPLTLSLKFPLGTLYFLPPRNDQLAATPLPAVGLPSRREDQRPCVFLKVPGKQGGGRWYPLRNVQF